MKIALEKDVVRGSTFFDNENRNINGFINKSDVNNVYVEGKPCVNVDTIVNVYYEGVDFFEERVESGSSNVFVNNKSLARDNDKVSVSKGSGSCRIVGSSSSVFAN